jgi:hypothetical protein
MVPVFNIERPGPNLLDKTIGIDNKAFIVEGTDGITSQKTRPICNHELLTALGYPIHTVKELFTETTWEQVYDHITDTAPCHTFAPLFACLLTVEIQVAEHQLETQ